MNKSFFIILFVLLLMNSAFAKDVAYVVKTVESSKIISSLNELGYSYDLIDDQNVPDVNFSNYAIILVQDSITNKDYLPLTSKNILFISKDYAPLVWTSGTVVTGSSNIFSAKLDQLGTVFTEGLSSITFDAYTTAKPEYYLHVYPAGITSVARSTGSTGSYPIVAYSITSNIRKVFFGFYSVDYWSDDTKTLFKNSLKWLRLGFDYDKDGYYSDNDCNDNDALKWRNLTGYLDSDRDGFGIGNSLQICSGTNLPVGYSNVGGDCNDTNSNTWRYLNGYLDKDLDGRGTGSILQVCSGNNLTSGYSNFGSDCNDTNSNTWRLISAYVDSDLDGFGSGNELQICSGLDLTSGYSNFGSDCNDSDNSKWQNLNGFVDRGDGFGTGFVEDVCSGNILSDGYSTIKFDCNNSILQYEKGFCLLNLSDSLLIINIVNQTNLNCSVNGSLLSYSSLENYGNASCDIAVSDSSNNVYNYKFLVNILRANNNAPILQDLDDVIVYDGDTVLIEVNGSDPENDEITYSINDTRFTLQNKTFSWLTSEGDENNYTFVVSATDGYLVTSVNVNVQVKHRNKLPICNNIPLIFWNENEKFSLNLNNYCSDPEESDLIYSIGSLTPGSIFASINNSVVEFSSAKNWFGSGNIVFSASDGLNTTLTNPINLTVNPVNQAPVFEGIINDFRFNQNTNLTNKMDLKTYFTDNDSSLIFNVTGNHFVEIKIDHGIVSFYPKEDFFGTESVVFSASDQEFTIYSDPVNIMVSRVDKPPVFGINDCSTLILENTNMGCELNATDPENESISFSVLNQNNLSCNISGNTLNYASNLYYYGSASCTIRATDLQGSYSDYTLNTNITKVNYVPLISDYSPRENSTKILTNVSKRFMVFARDVHSDPLNISWMVNDLVVGQGSSYSFANTNGNYVLTAVVSNGQYDINHSWNIVVGGISQFTCSEISGYVCNENQTCSGQILGVSDSNSCCNVSCSSKPPEFNNIKNTTIENKTDKISITIKNANEDFYFGDNVTFEINVKNLMDQDLDADLQVYLYDLTRQRIIDRFNEDFNINNDNDENANITFSLSEDLREGDDYYLFVRVIGKNEDKNKFYNQTYKKVSLHRKDFSLVINNIEFNPEHGSVCDDLVEVKTSISNFGKYAQYVKIRIENSDFGLSQLSDSFRIGTYDEDASEKIIEIKIPSNAKEGTYKIKVSVDGGSAMFEKEIELGACKNQINVQKSVDTIKINPSSEEIVSTLDNQPNNLLFLIVGLISVAMMAVILFVLGFYAKNLDSSNIAVSKDSPKLLPSKPLLKKKDLSSSNNSIFGDVDIINVYPKEERIVVRRAKPRKK